MESIEDYKKGIITFSEAAHQAGLILWGMQSFLIENGFKSTYSLEDLNKEKSLLKL